MQSAWRGWTLFSAALALPLMIWMWPQLRIRQINRAAEQIRVGDQSRRVHQLLGKPWKDEACGVLFAGQPAGCTEEMVYAHPYAPYVPEYWIVYLDSGRRVINQSHLISP
jgi:hypothetical protein